MLILEDLISFYFVEKKTRLNILRMGRQDKMLPDVQKISVQNLLERDVLNAIDADSDEVKGYKKEVTSAMHRVFITN